MKRYSFDTSAFIEPWHRHYPPELFGPLWKHIDDLAKRGVVVAQQAVSWEIQEKTDELAKWLEDREYFFRETTEQVQLRLREILKTHSRLLSATKNRSGADPLVIAQAQEINGSVVTYETWDENRRNIKIPEVCHDLGIPCITFVEFMKESGIKFDVKKRPRK